jgi:hypothetical protein|tara:strand:- start:4255 stop:5262 length:1008 start_codon:yes stop_codon:yes gene_type:complete
MNVENAESIVKQTGDLEEEVVVELEEEQSEKEEVKAESSEPQKEEVKAEIAEPEEPKVEAELSEEVSDEELETYSKGVQKRIKKQTAKFHQEKRDKEEAIRVAQLQQQEIAALKSRMQQLDTGYVAEYGGRLESQKAAAHRAYKIAHEEGDSEALLAAQEVLNRVAIEEQRFHVARARQQQAQQQPQQQVQQPQQQVQQPQQQMAPPPQQVDPKAKAWTEKNEWFGKDEVMTASAFAIHNNLEAEGFDTGSDEYYNAVDRQLREYFPEKFSDAQPKKTGGGNQVAPAGSSASRNVKSGRRTVKLSPSQVAMAKKLNVPLDRYAKEFLKTSEKANN